MSREEQEAQAAEEARRRFELAVPHIIGNPFLPSFPHAKQQILLSAHMWDQDPRGVFECLFGGAAGGGKSYALLIAAAQYAWKFPNFSAVLLRRTHTELAKAGALMERAIKLWVPLGVHWDGTNKVFVFPSGARVEMGYHGHSTDDAKYQGGEWHLVGFDELTHWPDPSAFEWLRSRCRKKVDDPIPLRLIGTSNPGGPGHTWVKNRFIGGTDPITGRFVQPRSLYIPATIDDNPSLDREAYKETLRDMHPTRRRQLLDGDWSAREPGDYFRIEWFGPLLDPEHDAIPRDYAIEVRWWDLAASEKVDAARTAGVRMARLRHGVRAITHATAFRATPGKRDDKIVQQAHADGRAVVVGLEIEGGSGGPAQFEALAKRLGAEGFRVVGARPKAELTQAEGKTMMRNPIGLTGKEARADPVASCLERGYQRRGECPDTGGNWWGLDAGRSWTEQRDGLRIFAGPWTQGYIDELEGFPEATLKDLVDATSGAWAWLEAHPFGSQTPPELERQEIIAELAGVHPDDRGGRRLDGSAEDFRGGKDRAGRWRP